MSTEFGFTCPAGGQWYACGAGTSKFVGCCTSDPCSQGCAQGNIRPGGFNSTTYGKFPDGSCGSASTFYTCVASPTQTFWGCCKSNPCSNKPAATCNDGDLVPAFMERPEQFSIYAPSATPDAKSSSSNGAVIGGAIGGGLGAALIIGILIFFFCRRRKRTRRVSHPEVGATASTPMMKDEFQDRHSAQYVQSPPPTYSSPNPDYYQTISPAKGHVYQQYGEEAVAPQELPADFASSAGNRYSELPAEASSSKAHRISEMPAGANQLTAELESPQPSPRQLQGEFPSTLASQVNHGNVVGSDDMAKRN